LNGGRALSNLKVDQSKKIVIVLSLRLPFESGDGHKDEHLESYQVVKEQARIFWSEPPTLESTKSTLHLVHFATQQSGRVLSDAVPLDVILHES
jgi:hypothetical protein